MKSSITTGKKYLLIALLLICKGSFAQYISSKEEKTNIAYLNSKVLNITILPTVSPLLFQVIVNNPECQPLEIQLKNKESKTFQHDIFYAKEYYTLELNTARLEDGDYTMSIRNNKESYFWKLTLETVGITSKNKETILEREVLFSEEESSRTTSRPNYYVKSN